MFKKIKEIKEAMSFLANIKNKDTNIMIVSFMGETGFYKIQSITRDLHGYINVEGVVVED